MGTEDYKGARKKLTLARITLMGVPDSELAEERIQWQRQVDDIEKSIRELERDQSRANQYTEGPILFHPIVQVRE